MNLFHKLATLCDATADHLDEQMKVAAAEVLAKPVPASVPVIEKQAARGADYLSEVYTAVTGRAPDQAVLDKLANDESLRETFLKLAEHAGAADTLGGPADRDDQPAEPKTAAERQKRADDRFGEWILNG